MFTKDSRTENFLTQLGVEFRYTNAVTFAGLEPDWAAVNLARPVPIREEAVLEYAALMEAGSAAPAPMLHDTGAGYGVLDGMQRLSAAQLNGYTQLSAYIVVSDSADMLTAIRVLANARLQGRAEPLEWTRRRAVEILVGQRGMSAVEVAKLGGWRVADIEKIARALDWGFKIRCIGGPEELSDAMIDTLARHTTQAELAREAKLAADFLLTVKQAQFSAADAEPYIETFFQPVTKAGKAHAIYKARLEDFKQDSEVVARTLGRRSAGLSKDVNLRRLLRAATTVLDEIVDAGEPVAYIDEFFRMLNVLEDKLHRIAKKHTKPDRPAVPGDKWVKHE